MNDINPIKPVMTTPLFTEGEILLLWGIGAVLVSLVIFGLIYWFYKKKPSPKPKPMPKPQPRIGLESMYLEQLKKLAPLITSEAYDIFYLEITNLVKSYVSEKYGFAITPLTTRETIKNSHLNTATKKFLTEFLHQVDEAKFAKKFQEQSIAEKIYQLVFTFFQI